jgi:hypothetical protein
MEVGKDNDGMQLMHQAFVYLYQFLISLIDQYLINLVAVNVLAEARAHYLS